MKRFTAILCFLLLAGVVAADAQIYRGKSSIRTINRTRKVSSSKYPCYQGEVNLGYGYSPNYLPENGDAEYYNAEYYNTLSRGTFETVNGVRINPYLFAGIGIGIACFYEEADEVLMPVSASLRGYYPVTKRFEPYVALDLGYSCKLYDLNDYDGGFYMAYGIGFNYGKLNFGIGLQRLIYTDEVSVWRGEYYDYYYKSYPKHTLQIKVGVKF